MHSQVKLWNEAKRNRLLPFLPLVALTLQIPPDTFPGDRPKAVMPLTCFVAEFAHREVDKDEHWMWVARVLGCPRGE